MMERYYHIAGLDICIKGNDEEMYTEEYRLKAFASEKKESDYQYEFRLVNELNEPEGICIYQDASKNIYRNADKEIRYLGVVRDNLSGAYIRCESEGNTVRVQVRRKEVPERITSKVLLSALGIETLAVKTDGFILHAAFIQNNGKAILFTAPSGTGKSTQAELWNRYRGAEIINGDRTIVRKTKNGFAACGIPFSGSSGYCKNAEIPLAAIVYLGQSSTNTISLMNGIVAFRKIWEQITVPIWNKDAVEYISDMIVAMFEEVPVYYLACTADERAVNVLETELLTGLY